MIVVLADDLSGAAELAGEAVRHGLTAELHTALPLKPGAEVVCFDTNTRLLHPTQAAARVTEVARAVLPLRPGWVFKKCDSALRGSVLAEANAMAAVFGRTKILLVPANPSRQRVIRNGKYSIEGRPLHETVFGRDPIHPARTSDVRSLLGYPPASVEIPDVAVPRDVTVLASQLRYDALPVGGADFFNALLALRAVAKPPTLPPFLPAGGRALLVCGSAAAWADRETAARNRGVAAFALPHDLAAISSVLHASGRVALGIGSGPATTGKTPEVLLAQLGASVSSLLKTETVGQLLLEGGATAAAVVAAQQWTHLRAEYFPEPGVGALRPLVDSAPAVFIKPGTYPWPPLLWT